MYADTIIIHTLIILILYLEKPLKVGYIYVSFILPTFSNYNYIFQLMRQLSSSEKIKTMIKTIIGHHLMTDSHYCVKI